MFVLWKLCRKVKQDFYLEGFCELNYSWLVENSFLKRVRMGRRDYKWLELSIIYFEIFRLLELLWKKFKDSMKIFFRNDFLYV